MSTLAQKGVPDIDESEPWPDAPDAPCTRRQVWCATVQAIADRAKATLPECSGRVDAAVKLVLAGDVELLPDGHARVQSQSNGQTIYRLVNGSCDCRDFEYAPSHWCKHKIAAGIMKRAGLSSVVEMPEDTPAAEPQEPVQTSKRQIPAHYVQQLQGKPFIKYMGLLQMAHEEGLTSLTEEWACNDQELSLAHATAAFADGRVFAGSGDSTPQNARNIGLAWRRMALTRAKARALRDGLAIDMCSVEEME
jgi:hypothetical protein